MSSTLATPQQVRDFAGLLSAVLTDLWYRLLVCISSMSVAVEIPITAELEAKMLNFGLVSRASAATHSPILGRSKSPRRCGQRDSPPSGRGSPLPPCRGFAVETNAESLPIHCLGARPAVADKHHPHFPHFQPPSCPEIAPSKKSSSFGCCTSAKPFKSRTMYPCDLAAKMENMDDVLLIDCRSFIAFNLNHINGSLNVSCSDRLTKKRLQCNKILVGDLISPGQDAKDEFSEKRCSSATLVLYDDNTEDLERQLTVTSPLHLVLSSLNREGLDALVLKGGLSAFQSRYSNLCVKPCNKPTNVPLFSPTTPLIHTDIDTATISEILPFLYIGNERDAACRERLTDTGITHILNVTSHLPLNFDGEDHFEYCRLSASDSAHQNLTQYFDGAFDFIEKARQSNGKVMIHCQAGVSRSSTLVIAYIMKNAGLTLTQAFHFVKSKRSIIAPNFNFMGQLMEFEQQLSTGQIIRDLAQKLTLEDTV